MAKCRCLLFVNVLPWLCLATPTWQSITGTSSPSDRYGLNAAAMTDGSVVFLGGPDSSTSGSTWHLSLRNQSAAVWNKLPDPPYSVSGTTGRWGTVAALRNANLSLVHMTATHDIYQFTLSQGIKAPSGSWQHLLGSGNTAVRRRRWHMRYHASLSSTSDGSMLLCGGYISWLLQTGSSSYSSYFHTTTSTNDMVARLTISGTALSWTSITGSLGQRAGHVAVVLPDDSLIIHGGFGRSTATTSSTWLPALQSITQRLVISGTTYSFSTVSTSGTPTGRCFHSAVMVNGEMLIYGGLSSLASGSTGLSDLRRLTFSSTYTSGTWSLVSPSGSSPGSRLDFAFAALPFDGSVVLFAGRTTYSSTTDVSTATRVTDMCSSSCSAGQEWSGSACVTCSSGWNSAGGCNVCRPTLSSILSPMPMPTVTVSADSLGNIVMLVSTPPLPALMPLYDSVLLYFNFDIASDSGSLSAENACTSNWILESENNFSLSITYDQLRDDCKLNENITSEALVRSGVVGVFLMSEASNSQIAVVKKWLFPLEAEFQHKAVATFENFGVWEPEPVQSLSVSLGTLASQLHLYEDNSFAKLRVNSVYNNTETAYLQHSLMGSDVDTLTLQVEAVWLSNSSDSSAAAMHDLTAEMQMISQLAATAHFSVSLVTCNDCFLHVRSGVQQYNQSSSRRLGEEMAAQYLIIRVVGPMADVTDPGFGDTNLDAIEPLEQGSDLVLAISLGVPTLLAYLVAMTAFFKRGSLRGWFQKYQTSLSPSLTQAELTCIDDSKVCEALQQMLNEEAGEAKKLQGLKLEDVWRVPVDSSGFVARKGKIQEELKRIAEAKFDGLVLNTTTTQLDVSLKHLGELDGASNEKILLHSATPENLYDLIFEGLHVSKSGISFVENMADIASRDAPGNQGESETWKKLQKLLFEDFGKALPEKEIHFALVCRVLLGFPAFTLDGTSAMGGPLVEGKTCLPAGEAVMESSGLQLVRVPDLHPPVRYHSLIRRCPTGGTLASESQLLQAVGELSDPAPTPPADADELMSMPAHEAPILPSVVDVETKEISVAINSMNSPDPCWSSREFAIFDPNATLPVFLLAYSKCSP